MGTKAFFSNRIYKTELEQTTTTAFSHVLRTFNQAKHFAAQQEIIEKRSGTKMEPSIHLRVKGRYKLNDYYTNSAVQAAKASNASQEELKKLYTKKKETRIKSTAKKIKATKSRLTVLRKIKQSFVKGKPTFNKTSREQQKGRYFVVQFREKTDIYWNAYDFEHLYLDKEIQYLRSRLGNIQFKQDRVAKHLETLRRKTKSVCFGSRKLARHRTTKEHYQNNPQAWKEDWEQARYSKMTISGRKDAKHGNFVFQYEPSFHTLFVRLPDGRQTTIPNVSFPYGQEKVDVAVNRQVNLKNKKAYGKPIAWSLEDCGDYYIVKCILDVEPETEANYSKSDGVIGIDLNVDHFAVATVNNIGQLTDSFCLAFDIQNKTSNQIEKIIEAEAIALVAYASRHHKPIVLEDIDTTVSKANNAYGNKKANQRMSMFAYRKMSTAIKSRAEKMGVAVFEVNPAYTSQIGKMKYMKRLGISIHQAASFVIARRAMGFKEKLPPVLYSLVPEKKQGLHHWAHWAQVTKILSSIRTDTFYGIALHHFDGLNDWHSLFPQKALMDFEVKGLPKWKSRKTHA